MLLWEHYPLSYLLTVVSVSMLVDAVFGDPDWLYKKIPHPVVIIGRLLDFLERHGNKDNLKTGNWAIFIGGVGVSVAVVVFTSLAVSVLLLDNINMPLRFAVEVGVVSVLLAQNSLYRHVKAVAVALSSAGLRYAQEELQKLVSRDAKSLNEEGVARSAVESLAENFSDGVVAPLFWFVVAGLPGIVFYKVVNTADSMWGYKNERYRNFGKCAALLDDAVNYLPARMSVPVIAMAAVFAREASAGRLFAVVASDAKSHASPNAGYPEAAFAGALNLSLGGERHYPGGETRDGWIGKGNPHVRFSHVEAALSLYKWALCVLWIACTAGSFYL